MKLISYFSLVMPQRLVYMLQTVEYDHRKFWKWLSSLPNLQTVMRRGRLHMTRKAQALLLVGYGISVLCLSAVLMLGINGSWLFALGLFLATPIFTIIGLGLTTMVGYGLLTAKRRPLLAHASAILNQHPAVKIAVLGSYGKTTMKELLLTVLGEAKRVKATPGNMNVPISHARWVTSKIDGQEEVIIFEYGEGESGDIAKFAELTHPDKAIITGIAPNHLDRYPSYDALADDLLSIRQFVDDSHLVMAAEATKLHEKAPDIPVFSESGVKDWKVENVKVSYQGVSFDMKNAGQNLKLASSLLGRHQVGPLAAVAAQAVAMGMTSDQVEKGIAKTKPFEHRMQARELNGAWIIDDTYNGNLEGIKAGLRLMQDLPAERKTYVTPGLVDQGVETERVHHEIGKLIAEAKPNKVVLMKNSVTKFIQAGLETENFRGELVIEENPLEFYQGIEHHLAAGDLVVMQNDWTDNYS